MTLKATADYILALLLLILLLPLMIFLAILISVTSKGPVIYSQPRIGKDGKVFYLYKFRSMKHDPGNGVHLLSGRNDPRITAPGRFMRKHRLDELPNFINILKGEMSLVGPRPEQEYFTEQIRNIRPEYAIITTVKPGITSWGQVQYGYASDLSQMLERLDYDLFYVRNKSISFDLKIILKTFGIIVRGQGI
jgi:lipopolysaccharide/colanic/teichoic acid biosynthesis glycosyltransferase